MTTARIAMILAAAIAVMSAATVGRSLAAPIDMGMVILDENDMPADDGSVRPKLSNGQPDLAAPHSGHAERLSDSGQQAGSLVAALLTQAGEAIAVAQHRHAKPRHRTVERQYRTHPVSLGWRSKMQLGIVPG